MFMNLIKKAISYAALAFIFGQIYKALIIILHNLLEEKKWPLIEYMTPFSVEFTFSYMDSPLLYAPLFETGIFCYLLYRIYSKFKLQQWLIFRQWGFILPSAFLFSLLHLIEPGTGFYKFGDTFLAGLFLAHLFLTTVKTHNIDIAFWTTTLAHSTINFFPFILAFLFL